MSLTVNKTVQQRFTTQKNNQSASFVNCILFFPSLRAALRFSLRFGTATATGPSAILTEVEAAKVDTNFFYCSRITMFLDSPVIHVISRSSPRKIRKVNFATYHFSDSQTTFVRSAYDLLTRAFLDNLGSYKTNFVAAASCQDLTVFISSLLELLKLFVCPQHALPTSTHNFLRGAELVFFDGKMWTRKIGQISVCSGLFSD